MPILAFVNQVLCTLYVVANYAVFDTRRKLRKRSMAWCWPRVRRGRGLKARAPLVAFSKPTYVVMPIAIIILFAEIWGEGGTLRPLLDVRVGLTGAQPACCHHLARCGEQQVRALS